MRTWILDTGPLLAYLDRRDPAHETAKRALDEVPGRLVTTSAVITEVMHFASEVPHGPAFVSDFMTAARIDVLDYAQPPSLRRAVPLMERYADTPMDFADATLMLLAEDLGIREILTLDRRGFATFRTPSGESLVNLIDLA